jgi:hypothetical protein
MKDLASDSIDAVVAFVSKEKMDGSLLDDRDIESEIAAQVSGQIRRARVIQILKAICSPSVATSVAGGSNGCSEVAVSADLKHLHIGNHSISNSTPTPTPGVSTSSFSAIGSPSSAIMAVTDPGVVVESAECEDKTNDGAVYGPPPPPSFSSADSSLGSSDLQNLAARLVDVDASLFEAGMSPIQGIATAELLNFADAVKRCGVKGMALNIKCAAKHGAMMKNHGDGGALTADHIAAIHMYTQACDFYRTLNACLRNRNRDYVIPFFPYLRLLLEALRQLPAQKRVVYRGVKLDLSTKFKKGDEPVWWSVTSTSTTMEVLQSKDFCGQDGPRTVFVVQASHARDIAAFSAFASEEELILLPGAQLQVKSVVPMGGGLHLVQMDEIDEPMSLIEFEDDE